MKNTGDILKFNCSKFKIGNSAKKMKNIQNLIMSFMFLRSIDYIWIISVAEENTSDVTIRKLSVMS